MELISPLADCINALRDGTVHFVGASAHAPLLSFPEWTGAKLLCAQSQGTYWLLIMRKDLGITRGDIAALKGRRIAAVPFVGAALKRILLTANIDPVRDDIEIMMPEAASRPGTNFGVAAAQALREGTVDGFFANGMGAELAVRDGIGNVVLDIRRGIGPKESFHYTFPAIATTDALIAQVPDVAAKVIRAIETTQAALKKDIALAAMVGAKLFPPREAALIAGVVDARPALLRTDDFRGIRGSHELILARRRSAPRRSRIPGYRRGAGGLIRPWPCRRGTGTTLQKPSSTNQIFCKYCDIAAILPRVIILT